MVDSMKRTEAERPYKGRRPFNREQGRYWIELGEAEESR